MASETSDETRYPRSGRGVRRTRHGEEGVIYAWVPAPLAMQAKQLAVEQKRALRDVVHDALREYIDRVDATEASAASAEATKAEATAE